MAEQLNKVHALIDLAESCGDGSMAVTSGFLSIALGEYLGFIANDEEDLSKMIEVCQDTMHEMATKTLELRRKHDAATAN